MVWFSCLGGFVGLFCLLGLFVGLLVLIVYYGCCVYVVGGGGVCCIALVCIWLRMFGWGWCGLYSCCCVWVG